MDVDVSSSDGFSHVYNSMNDSLAKTNPIVLIILTVIIIVYFFIFSYLGYTPGTPTSAGPKSLGLTIIEVIMWGLIIFLVLINGLQYFFQIDMKTAVKNLFLGTPEVDIQINPETQYEGGKKGKDGQKKNNSLVKELEKDLGLSNLEGNRDAGSLNNQVFNIPGNDYTYEDASALCKAYGGDLATYSQIESAYKSGAEWCNYGWSKDQMAYYPTQKTTWNKLQKIKGHKHDCGRPGINGGYIKNPRVRFGVNCYGPKPSISEEEQKIMNNAVPYPLTKDERQIKQKTDKYKKNLSQILVSPFNYENWSQI
jgi:hypothetical protein